MRGFVGAIYEADLYLTEPSLRDIGGLAYKRKYKNM